MFIYVNEMSGKKQENKYAQFLSKQFEGNMDTDIHGDWANLIEFILMTRRIFLKIFYALHTSTLV